MTVDTKLREASNAIRRARQEAGFTVKAPTASRRLNGPMLAWVAGLTMLLLVGIPALMTVGPVDQQTVGNTAPTEPLTEASAPSDADPDSEPVTVDSDFPYLALDASDWYPTGAADITDDETGVRIGTQVEYAQSTEDGSGGGILLRLHTEGQDHPEFMDLFMDLKSRAEGEEMLRVGDRDMTLYTISDETLAEDGAVTHALHWTEAPGTEAVVIAWGLDRATVLGLVDHLQRIGHDAWLELTLAHAVTSTTLAPDAADPSPLESSDGS